MSDQVRASGGTKGGSLGLRPELEEGTGALGSETLVKSRQRVSDHGEVFTPSWMVESMLDLVRNESERIDSRFLEPACGSGNFLKVVLARKLMTVRSRYGKSEFELRHYALLSLMSVYGIELLKDNVEECRQELLELYASFLRVDVEAVWYQAGIKVLEANIIQGDAQTLLTSTGEPIVFPEWGYLGSGKFQRRDFKFDALTQRASIIGTLFELLEEDEVFVPIKTYPQMTVDGVAQ